MRECFADNRHVVFFSELPGKRAYGVLLERPLERTCNVGKGVDITQQRMHDLCGIGSPCYSLLVFAGLADAGLHR